MSADKLCYVALGSNLGDRLRLLSRALRDLAALPGVRLTRTSSLYETSPQYVTDQPRFLNAVAEVELSTGRLEALPELLSDLKGIEAALGRRSGARWGPRPVDLDIIAVGQRHLSEPNAPFPLEVPHLRMHERDFVLVPMAELSPQWRHPVRHATVAELLNALDVAAKDSEQPPRPVQVIPAAGGLHGRQDGAVWVRGERTLVMGILNVTPDSFSDGGDYLLAEAASAAAQAMLEAGADIIDVGGESTRPGAPEVPIDEEIGRVVPIIRAIRERRPNATISVDTRKAAVAREAVAAGADWINDVSGGSFDPAMLPIAAELMAPVVLMHMKGTPETMNSLAVYDALIEELGDSLAACRDTAEASGVPKWNVALDPGIGFAKTMEHNLAVLRHCGDLVTRLQPSPLLIGASRKRFLGAILGEEDPKRRVFGNAACTAAAVAGGADFVRVHEAREMAQVCAVSDRIFRSDVSKL